MNYLLNNLTVEELIQLGKENHEAYVNNAPFPNHSFDNLLSPEFLGKVLAEFPSLENGGIKFNDANQIKYASVGEKQFGDNTKILMHFLNSEPFLEFLTNLTGIQDLIPDPYFEGGGYHQSKAGGMLKIHADFNKNRKLGLDRRINVLVYLNKDWEESYGGHFELWDEDMKKCEKRFLPIFNRMAMFSTTSTSYHGLPEPITCPDDRSRQSLALYYYTNGRPDEEIIPGKENHRTLFKQRPGKKNEGDKLTVKTILEAITPPIIMSSLKKAMKK